MSETWRCDNGHETVVSLGFSRLTCPQCGERALPVRQLHGLGEVRPEGYRGDYGRD